MEAHHWLKHKDLYGCVDSIFLKFFFWQYALTSTSVPLLGPISSVTTMGKTIIIINDSELALELLNDDSVKTASRPHSVISGDMYA